MFWIKCSVFLALEVKVPLFYRTTLRITDCFGSMMVRVSASKLSEPGSNPGPVTLKTFKMVLVASSLGNKHKAVEVKQKKKNKTKRPNVTGHGVIFGVSGLILLWQQHSGMDTPLIHTYIHAVIRPPSPKVLVQTLMALL